MQPKQNMPMPRKNNNALDNFGPYKNEGPRPEAQDIEGDYRDLVGKSSDTRSRVRAGRTPQNRLLGSESSSSLREVRFSEQEFLTGTPVSNIKYDPPVSQNDNLFYLFYNQVDYSVAHYFAESENTKGNVDKFLSNLLMAPLTEKLFYQNADKWMEKLSEIPWGIPNNKWIEHKFELQSGVAGMARREIAIHSQNVVGCLEFLMRHPGFRHNQTFEPSCVYNENEERVYNEMHTGEW